LEGLIPSQLGQQLPELNTVSLYKISNLINPWYLVMLDLSDNMLTATIPPELAQLTNLYLLNIICNRLKGGVPAGIAIFPICRC
jgi:hypothetical protein